MSHSPFSTNGVNLAVAQFFTHTRRRKILRNFIILGIILAYPLYFLMALIIIYTTPFPASMKKEVIADINGYHTVYTIPPDWHITSVHKVPFIFPLRVYSDEGNIIDEEWCITISPPLEDINPTSHESVSEFIWYELSTPPSPDTYWYLQSGPCVINGRIPNSGG